MKQLGAKTPPILSQIRLTLTALPWKGNQFSLGTQFLITEYQAAIKSA
jgi:hypothetical protein